MEIKRIKIVNFMGVSLFETTLSRDVSIYGANASGKSTIYTAFLWLLDGKNQAGETNFPIKNTVDLSKNRMDHIVEIDVLHDFKIVNIKKIYREKWQKKKGSIEEELTGHENEYFVDNVPMSLSEYKLFVGKLFPETLYKILTNVYFVNEMHWDKRREMLLEISDIPTDNAIIVANPSLNQMWIAKENRTVDGFLKYLNASIKSISEELEKIPLSIDELNLQLAQPVEDKKSIEDEIISIKQKREKETEKIQSESAASNQIAEQNKKILDSKKEIQDKIILERQKLNEEYQQKIFDLSADVSVESKKLSELETQLQKNNSTVREVQYQKEQNSKEIERLSTEKDKLLKEYHELKAVEYSPGTCPTCLREKEFKEDDKEAFIRDLNERLEKILAKGKSMASQIEELISNKFICADNSSTITLEIEAIKAKILAMRTKINSIPNPVDNDTILSLVKEAESHKLIQSETTTVPNNLKLYNDKIEELTKKLGTGDMRDQLQARIIELTEKTKSLSIEKSSHEKFINDIENFSKIKNQYVEESVNKKFTDTKFILYKDLINGGSEPCCIATYKGVPYQSVNTAGRINMGLDIINALSNHYQVELPIFIDNAESVNKLMPVASQIIKLIVSNDKKLRIENE